MRTRRVALIAALPLLGLAAFVGFRLLGPRAPAEHPCVLVTTLWAGGSSLEVEKQVTIPLERALSGIQGIAAEASTSTLDVSTVRLELAPSADEFAVRQHVIERLQDAALPSGALPTMGRSGTRTLTFAVMPEPSTDLGTVRTIAEWELERAMKQIAGVSDVTECGGRERHVEVRLDAARLRPFGVQPSSVVDALSAHEMTGALRASGYADVDALEKVPVAVRKDGATPVTLADVAQVDVQAMKLPECIAREGGSEIVLSEITLMQNADVEQVARDVAAKLQELRGRFPVRLVALEMEKRAPWVHVRAWTPPAETDALVPTVRALPEAAGVFSRTTEDKTELMVRAAPTSDPTKLARAIARALDARPGVVYDLTSPQVELPRELRAVRVRVLGPDLARLQDVARAIAEAMRSTPGVGPAWIPDARMKPTITITPERVAMARHGVDAATLSALLELRGEGRVVSTFIEGTRRFDVVVRMLGPKDEASALQQLTISTSDGSAVPVSLLASSTLTDAPWQISRANGSRVMDVYFDVRDAQALADARKAITTKLNVPAGMSLTITREGD